MVSGPGECFLGSVNRFIIFPCFYFVLLLLVLLDYSVGARFTWPNSSNGVLAQSSICSKDNSLFLYMTHFIGVFFVCFCFMPVVGFNYGELCYV